MTDALDRNWRFFLTWLLSCTIHSMNVIAVEAPDDDAGALLSAACIESIDGSIHSGEFRYRLRVQTPDRDTEKEASGMHETVERIHRKLLERATDPKTKEEIEQVLKNNSAASFKKQLDESRDRLLEYLFILNKASEGGERYVQFMRLDPATQSPTAALPGDKANAMVFRANDASNSSALALNATVGVAFAGLNTHSGTQEPHRLGRMTGYLLDILTHEKTKELPTTVRQITSEIRVKSFPESSMIEIQCLVRPSDGRPNARFRFHVDPARGNIVPLIEEFTEDSRLTRSWVSENYFVVDGKIFFPGKCVYTQYPPRSMSPNSTGDAQRVETYEFFRESVLLNQPIAKERFEVEIPLGTTVISSDAPPLVASDTVGLALDDLPHLEKVNGLSPREESNRIHGSDAAGRSQRSVFAIVATNVVVLMLLAAYYWKRRASRQRASLICLLVLFTAGCNAHAEDDAATLEGDLRILPSSLALGKVVAGRDLSLHFELMNETASDVAIEINPACGCTTRVQGDVIVPRGSRGSVDLVMSTRGRAGLFVSSIEFVARDRKSRVDLFSEVVPITATFHTEWSASPERIVLAKESGAMCTVAVSGPSADWHTARVDSRSKDIQIRQLSSRVENGRETRTFRVVSRGGGGSQSVLTMINDSDSTAFLSVPVVFSSESAP